MELKRRTRRKHALLLCTLLGISLVLIGLVAYLSNSRKAFDLRFPVPEPPLSLQDNHFSCLGSLQRTKHKKRLAVLHGPDWILESTVEPKCLPEREVLLSVEVDRQFLSRPITDRIKFWVTSRYGVFHVKIVNSSVSEQLDNSALDLVTNQKCKTQKSKNCYVQSTRNFVNID